MHTYIDTYIHAVPIYSGGKLHRGPDLDPKCAWMARRSISSGSEGRSSSSSAKEESLGVSSMSREIVTAVT